MRLIRNAILFGLAVGAASIVGCSTATSPNSTGSISGLPGTPGDTTGVVGGTPRGDLGTVGLKLQLGPGLVLNTVQYTITNPTLAGFTTIVNSVDVSGSQTISFSLTLPVGSGYTLSLSAFDSNHDPCSGGPVGFSVLAGQSNSASLTLVCFQTIDGGVVGPDVNVAAVGITADASLQTTVVTTPCAAATGLAASPNETAVGHSMDLTASGIDPNNQSSDVTLTWVATGGVGSLTAATGMSNTFNCASPGMETVTVTAAISNDGASCPTIGSQTVMLTCDAILDASVSDAVADSGASDAVADTGVADAIVEAAGPLAPCTTSGQTGCVQCAGNNKHGGACTLTEQIIVARDIAKGYLTGSQLNTTAGSPTQSCYDCLWNSGCIDDDRNGDVGQECEDLTGTVGAGAQAAETKALACRNALNCIFPSGCQNAKAQNAGATDGIENCFCGSHGITIPLCEAEPTIATGPASAAANGSCAQIEIDGLGLTASTAITPLVNAFTTNTTGSGLANNMFLCAGSNAATFTCPTCFQ